MLWGSAPVTHGSSQTQQFFVLADSRIFRFFVCADARRSASEEVPLRLRYRDLVLTTYTASAMHEKVDAAKTSGLLQATEFVAFIASHFAAVK
ncbi:unnamed protein product [Symbiodinium sp. KB8]|nr:unnamed protein product [Symbiodinium sp. KB8]